MNRAMKKQMGEAMKKNVIIISSIIFFNFLINLGIIIIIYQLVPNIHVNSH